MPYTDKQKALEYKRNWNKNYYKQNKAVETKRIYDRRRKIALWFTEYKTRFKCIKCGEKESACLDFHHLDSKTKDISLSLSTKQGFGINRIMKEIDKCVVLCSNCHRKLHAGLIKL